MGASEPLFIAQIIVLLLVGRLLGEAMQRIGQPAVMGQLLAGVLLGPTVFGPFGRRHSRRCFPQDANKERCSRRFPISGS